MLGCELRGALTAIVLKLLKTMPGQPKNRGGKKGRSGRKSKAEEMGLAALLDKCWTPAAREKCVRALATKASKGDLEAVKLLLAYTFGKPRESVDVNQVSEVIFKVVYGDTRTGD